MKARYLLATALLLGASAPLAAQEAAGATATFINGEGAEIGTATLSQGPEGVMITGEVTDIPAGDHGFHIHETGTCDAATMFESAGGHFNPGMHQHGLENPQGPHAGDFVNVTAGDDGTLALSLENTAVTLMPDAENSLLDADGSALVIHADPDDQMTDPSGNSGDRIACAVIEAAN